MKTNKDSHLELLLKWELKVASKFLNSYYNIFLDVLVNDT